MNERIKELFQEAIDYADKTHTYTPEEGFNIQVWDKIRFEKFAELIIRECADTVLGFHNQFGDSAHNEIRQHFGVEE